ncbi:MAG: c-type cytochrome [Planctomycetes bacterium]|nr:c-type cytochrome [Planctomycetota bacterium]
MVIGKTVEGDCTLQGMKLGKDKKKKGSLKRKFLLGLLGMGVLAAGGVGYAWTSASSALSEEFEQSAVVLDIEDGDIDRGEYLANHVLGCADSKCHQADMGGGVLMESGAMGLVYAPNLTGGTGSVVKDYSAEDWDRVIRHGIKKDKTRAFYMPSEDYSAFPDEDISSVVAYIKSKPAVDRGSRSTELGPIYRMLIATGKYKFAYDKIAHNAKPMDVEPDNTKEYGAVLITTCVGCHGNDLTGGKIPGGFAANLTQHDSGLGKWSEEDFIKAMRTGKRPDGSEIKSLMPWQTYKGMTEDDMEALWL